MTYDIIFAGGGTTACVVAGRLAASRPDLRILLVEQGPHTRELQAHLQPALFPKNMTPDTKVFSFHISQPSNALMGRPIVVPSGRCVGGGSSINFMKYTRASASDYDDWETLYANEGWGSKDMIPLLKKVETYEVEGDQYSHGQSGPIKVSFGGVCLDPGKQFLEVAERYDKFRDVTQDANDFRTVNAYSRWPKYIDRSTGLRSDTAHGFVYNQDQAQNNLTVLADTTVLRVIIKDGRAIGIECDTSTPMSGTTKIFATQLVVISAGAFGSPAILQRSGIGPSQILTALGIPLVVDLPGVGENYLDHQAIVEPYFVSDSTTTLEAILEMDEEELHSQWQRSGDGLMATNGIDAGVKLRPSVDELRELGPGFQERWRAYFENAPDKPIIWMGPLSNYAGQDTDVPKRRYMSMVTYMVECKLFERLQSNCLMCYQGYPASTGRLYITASDLSRPLHFEPGYLNDPSDLEVLRWAYKKGREIARRMPLYRGEPIQCHPAFAPDSDAACGERSGPVDVSAPNIVYTPEDDEAINSHVRMKVQTSWHSMGTCAMKPRADGGVVDSKLNVYGLQGLKVAGEKAAVIIAQELGIKLCLTIALMTRSPESDARTPLPAFQLGIILFIQAAEPITASVIFPFVNQFVLESGVTRGDERKVGYYAGIIVNPSSAKDRILLTFFSYRVLCRKPVLLAGMTHPTKLAEKKRRETELAASSSRNYGSINNDLVEDYSVTEGATPSCTVSSPSVRSVLVRPIVISLTTHAFQAVTMESFRTLLPLMLSTSIPIGGLAFSSARIGTIMAVWGFCNGGFQLIFFARAIRRFGPKKTFRIAYGSYAICFALYPVMSYFAKRANGVDAKVVCVLVLQLSCFVLGAMSYGSNQLFIIAAVPGQNSLATVNGLTQMVSSIMRSLAPSIASSLFSLSVEHNLLGGYLVYLIIVLTIMVGLYAASRLPDKIEDEG
ncbi:hypothetical protein EYR40_008036 [Pleurotus pulmonarius]|nr:hypothetical protein EYR40_008036 [Pleurotus pulmonarius]